MDKLIITDADGVLLDWLTAFHQWMQGRGYVLQPGFEHDYSLHKAYSVEKKAMTQLKRSFNQSADIMSLKPHRDAVSGVKVLSSMGYRFIVVSCLASGKLAMKNRLTNLYDLFGANVFLDVICLDALDSKRPTLSLLISKYEDIVYYIEDNVKNIIIGRELGLKPIVMRSKYNQYYDTGLIDFADDWRSVVSIISKDNV